MIHTEKRKKQTQTYLLAFVIPVALLMSAFVAAGVYPFGDHTILVADMNFQFVDYFSYFKNTFFSNNNLIYTFSKNMGGDMIGITAYYLFSPFNFILLLFPENLLPVAVLIIYLLKIGCCGLTCNYMLAKKYGPRRASLIFSTGYALMAYVIVYMCSIMYFDGFILLPLIVLGLDRLIRKKKPDSLYIFTLAAALMTNYYIGFMICIFCVLYFCYEILLTAANCRDIMNKSRELESFIVSSALSGGMSAFLLIPTVFSLQDEKAAVSGSILHVFRNFSMIDVFSKFYSNSFNGNISTGLPNLYCGLAAALLLALYFCNRKIRKKEKLLSALFLSVLFVSFYVSSLNMVWHGFNEPIGFPYRYSFLAVLLTVSFAYRGFLELEGVSAKGFLLVSGLFLAYTAYLILSHNVYVTPVKAVFNLSLAALILLLLYLISQGKKTRSLLFLLAVIQFFDLGVNACSSYLKLEPGSMRGYQESLGQLGPVIGKIQSQDTGFYRIEKTLKRTHNDALQFQYNGLTHYSSCEKVYIHEFLGRMGFRNNGNWAFYNYGSTAFADSLLGVRYLISQFDATGKPYEQGERINHCTIFTNPFALSLGMGATDAIYNIDMEQEDLFLLQNDIAKAVTGLENEIHRPVTDVRVETVNVTKTEENGYDRYERIDPDQEAEIRFYIQIDNPGLLMGYFTAPDTQEAELFLNDDSKGSYFSQYRWDIADLGNHNSGKEAVVKLTLRGDSLALGKAYFYYEQTRGVDSFYQKASKSKCELEKISSSHLRGSVFMDESATELLFTIPYEKSWNIKIDGEKAEPVRVMGALMAVPVTPGSHEVELIYIPQGAYIGVIVTIISIILYFFFIGSKRWKN